MDEGTRTQWHLIREIRDALTEARIAWWLFGGWAIDFHAGTITRDHADIEIFLRAGDAARAHDALTHAGFLAPPALHPDEGQPLLKDGQEVGAWFLEHHTAGRSFTPGRWSDWPWAHASFDGPPLTLNGLEAPVMSAEGLLDMKLNFAAHKHGAPLRDKDVADIEILRNVIAAPRAPGPR